MSGTNNEGDGITTELQQNGNIVQGGGIQGLMPRQVLRSNRNFNNYKHSREILTRAWNTSFPSQLKGADAKMAQTPFRAVQNAGDLLSRQHYSCGGSSQTPGSRPGMPGLGIRFGSIKSNCDGSNIPPASCNTKFVFDSSDYVTYLKRRASNRNYNDITGGGSVKITATY